MQVFEDTVEIDDDQPSDEQLLLNAIEAAEVMPPRRWLARWGGFLTPRMYKCNSKTTRRYNDLVRGIAKATKPVPDREATPYPGVMWA
jgi:hypothetical protein